MTIWGVSLETVWRTVTEDIPAVRQQIADILATMKASEADFGGCRRKKQAVSGCIRIERFDSETRKCQNVELDPNFSPDYVHM
jgi:hypothetical protein